MKRVKQRLWAHFEGFKTECGFDSFFVTHDISTIEHLCDNVALSKKENRWERFDQSNLHDPKEAYTRTLLESDLDKGVLEREIYCNNFYDACICGIDGTDLLYAQIRFDAYKIIDYSPKLTTQIYDVETVSSLPTFLMMKIGYMWTIKIFPPAWSKHWSLRKILHFEHSGIEYRGYF